MKNEVTSAMSLNGAEILERRETTIFVRLPRALWRSCGKCICPVCKGAEGFWDTLAIATKATKGENDYTWTVHMPERRR